MTKTECSVIRAYAILSIFLHNYIHWLPNTPQENEFEFDVNRHWSFINSIISGSDIFINLFSYLGHLGVPVFVFLSGYGLAQKYDKQVTIGIKSFIAKHFTKLFKPLLGGMLIYIIVMYIRDGEWPTFHTFALQCSYTLFISFLSTSIHFDGLLLLHYYQSYYQSFWGASINTYLYLYG